MVPLVLQVFDVEPGGLALWFHIPHLAVLVAVKLVPLLLGVWYWQTGQRGLATQMKQRLTTSFIWARYFRSVLGDSSCDESPLWPHGLRGWASVVSGWYEGFSIFNWRTFVSRSILARAKAISSSSFCSAILFLLRFALFPPYEPVLYLLVLRLASAWPSPEGPFLIARIYCRSPSSLLSWTWLPFAWTRIQKIEGNSSFTLTGSWQARQLWGFFPFLRRTRITSLCRFRNFISTENKLDYLHQTEKPIKSQFTVCNNLHTISTLYTYNSVRRKVNYSFVLGPLRAELLIL